jgi:hypothetical protein
MPLLFPNLRVTQVFGGELGSLSFWEIPLIMPEMLQPIPM